MIINYHLVGHAVHHIVVGDTVWGSVSKSDLGHMRSRQWVARPYGDSNHRTFVGRTKYHAAREMMRFLLREGT